MSARITFITPIHANIMGLEKEMYLCWRWWVVPEQRPEVQSVQNNCLSSVRLLSQMVNWSSVKCRSTRPQLGPKSKLSDPYLQKESSLYSTRAEKSPTNGLTAAVFKAPAVRLSSVSCSLGCFTFPLAADSCTVGPSLPFIQYQGSGTGLVAWATTPDLTKGVFDSLTFCSF